MFKIIFYAFFLVLSRLPIFYNVLKSQFIMEPRDVFSLTRKQGQCSIELNLYYGITNKNDRI